MSCAQCHGDVMVIFGDVMVIFGDVMGLMSPLTTPSNGGWI